MAKATNAGGEDKAPATITRRGFAHLAGRAGAVVALGGLIGLVRQEGRIRRPPGALPEEEFVSVCIRCDKCWWACPYGLIEPVPITESIVNAGTPRLKRRTCPNCRRCIPACPVDALVSSRY